MVRVHPRPHFDKLKVNTWAHSSPVERFIDIEEVVGSTPTGPTNMNLKIIYEDDTLLVVDKPAGVSIENLPKLTNLGEEYRFGVVHRLDKETSGALLIAKTKEAFEFFQNQFAQRKVQKQYVCLVEGNMKQDSGIVHTLLARSPADRRKQKAYPLAELKEGRREALTEWKLLKRFEDYTLLEVTPKTGRKHQIRAHMAYLGHPIAGDKLYGFKNQKTPKGLTRQFLHATYLKILMVNEETKEFISELPIDLQTVIEGLEVKTYD